MARDRAGRDFTPNLSGDTPREVDEHRIVRAEAEAFETIEAARDLHGLRPPSAEGSGTSAGSSTAG